MANPQQPELRRSEQVPALHPDAMEAVLEAQGDKDLDAGRSAVERDEGPPADRPETDQDKPDLDEFADAFGVSKPSAEQDDNRTESS